MLVLLAANAAAAQTVTVSGRASVLGESPGPGCNGSANYLYLPPGLGRVLRISGVSGSVAGGPGWPFVSADGGAVAPCGSGRTNIPSTPYVAGIVADRTMFLCGMFVGGWQVPPVVPPRLEFQGDGQFEHLWPALRQPFYVGDGLQSGTGVAQTFAVPDEAGVLHFGFAEGVPCFEGPFGGTCDNLGELRVTLSFEDSCLVVPNYSLWVENCVGESCEIATGARGTGAVEFQWEFNLGGSWISVPEGLLPTGGGTVAQGARTPTLVLANLQPWDFSNYIGESAALPFLVLRLWANGCDNRKVVAEAVVRIRYPDFNGDGNADQDDVWYGYSAKALEDLNQDGNVDQDDYAYLIDWIASDPSACR